MARRLGMPRFRASPIRPTEVMRHRYELTRDEAKYSPYGTPVEQIFTADEREQMERVRDAARQNEHPKAFDLPNRSRDANLAFIQELYKTGRVSDQNFKRVHAVLGDAATVELVGILGYYVMISMILNVFRMAPPEDEPLPFAES